MVEIKEWRQEVKNASYIISTKRELLDLDFIQAAFATDDMYWAKPLPTVTLKLMLDSSQTLGLYEIIPAVPTAATDDEPSSPRTPSPTLENDPKETLKQVGMARFITDHVSTAYLTDVYMAPETRGLGLGVWLIRCSEEIMQAMPAFRRGFLMASPGKGLPFYEEALQFYDIQREKEQLICMTRRGW